MDELTIEEVCAWVARASSDELARAVTATHQRRAALNFQGTFAYKPGDKVRILAVRGAGRWAGVEGTIGNSARLKTKLQVETPAGAVRVPPSMLERIAS